MHKVEDNGAKIGRTIPAELHPHDARVVAVMPLCNYIAQGHEYQESTIITEGQDGRFWTARFIMGRHVEGSDMNHTTMRQALKRALAMGGW